MARLLCKRCDVFVGYGGLGVVKKPEDVASDELFRICWVCRRQAEEIAAEQAAPPKENT